MAWAWAWAWHGMCMGMGMGMAWAWAWAWAWACAPRERPPEAFVGYNRWRKLSKKSKNMSVAGATLSKSEGAPHQRRTRATIARRCKDAATAVDGAAATIDAAALDAAHARCNAASSRPLRRTSSTPASATVRVT